MTTFPTYNSQVDAPGPLPAPTYTPPKSGLVGMGEVLMDFSRGLFNEAAQIRKAEEALAQKRREEEANVLADAARVNAYRDFSTLLPRLQQQHRMADPNYDMTDPVNIDRAMNGGDIVLNEFSSYSQAYINGQVARAPTREAALKIRATLSDTAFGLVKSTIAEENKSRKEAVGAILDTTIDYDLARIASNPDQWDKIFPEAMNNLRSYPFLDADVLNSKVQRLTVETAATVSTNWFNARGQRFEDLSSIRTGEFGDDKINALWKLLPQDQRDKMYKTAADDFSLRLRIEDRNDRLIDKANKDLVNGLMIQMLDPNVSLETKDRALRLMIDANVVSLDQVIQIQGIVEGNDPVTNETDLQEALIMISDGEITDIRQVLERYELDGSTVSDLIMPRLESARDKRFQRVYSYMQKELGIPTGLLTVNQTQEVQAEMTALAALERYRLDNEKGDFLAKADELIQEFRAKNRGAMEARIKAIEVQRDALIRAGGDGNLDRANRMQIQIDAMRQKLGAQ